jgi:hypothetical protein
VRIDSIVYNHRGLPQYASAYGIYVDMSETRSRSTCGTYRQLESRLFESVDVASLAAFRVAFGVIMLSEVWRYFHNDWIQRYYVEPTFHFAYYGFGWLRPLPNVGIRLLFVGLGVCAVGVALGAWYRASAALFCLGFAYVFLIDEARYLNHFYLVCLVSLLMACLPAHRIWSIDARRRPELRCVAVATWSLWIMRAQVGIVYVYGGVAKLNADWLSGEPARMWLNNRTMRGLIPPALDSDAWVYVICYGGLLFDLLIVPLLLWRRTRATAFVIMVSFHVTNSWLFEIGIFPWFMIAATTLFLSPSWPRRLLRHGEAAVKLSDEATLRRTPRQRATLVLLGVYVAIQLLVPLRHWLYPGNVSWTEEGHRFSWHMKLRSKQADARFFVHDPATDETWEVDPSSFLTPWQYRKMATQPDMLLQFGHLIAEEFTARNPRAAGTAPVEVHADVVASLNDRPPQTLIDPAVDLAATPRGLLPASWIVPLGRPLTAPPPPNPDPPRIDLE